MYFSYMTKEQYEAETANARDIQMERRLWAAVWIALGLLAAFAYHCSTMSL